MTFENVWYVVGRAVIGVLVIPVWVVVLLLRPFVWLGEDAIKTWRLYR